MIDSSFPTDLVQFVEQEVASGRYKSEQELVHAAVRAMRDQEANQQRFRTELRQRLDALDRGERIYLENDDELRSFFAEVEAEVDAELAAQRSR